ncbi:26032_t:CDS:2 [Gigaspora margarita]|uniref:DNA-directed RNA polymerases I and III subunit RPAC2 n=2 Tax=Gigaspora margarita TaxID=4874 RepID=A0A8H3X932_GIGMA|nr:DNA-directed RNA polymerases I and III subunit RPAC2 [Gigaspora margarita]CAG8768853.1 26032_t:CDS:2 [Gigaspora margarita]
MDTSGDNDSNSGEDQTSLFNENISDDLLEFATVKDPTSLTFSISGEDHTLGNALRYVITLNPEVEYCGYSIPHPSEDKLNIRIQTTENTTAIEAMRKGLEDLKTICDHIKETFIRSNRLFDIQQ